MSTAVFPTLPGIKWSVFKTPIWRTRIQKSVSGRELRAAFYAAPLWRFKLSFEILRSNNGYNEFQTLVGFFNARRGSYDTFLFTDPTDYAVSNQVFGTGDGNTVAYQLQRTLGSAADPVYAPSGTPSIYDNGVLVTPTVDSTTGKVTFASAPAAGHTLTWSGQFYFRCRFDQDEAEFEQFMSNLWSAGRIEFTSVKP